MEWISYTKAIEDAINTLQNAVIKMAKGIFAVAILDEQFIPEVHLTLDCSSSPPIV